MEIVGQCGKDASENTVSGILSKLSKGDNNEFEHRDKYYRLRMRREAAPIA